MPSRIHIDLATFLAFLCLMNGGKKPINLKSWIIFVGCNKKQNVKSNKSIFTWICLYKYGNSYTDYGEI